MASEREIVILNEKGLHVRPAAAFAQAAMKFRSRIVILREGRSVNAKSPIELLTLAAVQGTRLVLRAEGDDEAEATAALGRLVDDRFGMREDD